MRVRLITKDVTGYYHADLEAGKITTDLGVLYGDASVAKGYVCLIDLGEIDLASPTTVLGLPKPPPAAKEKPIELDAMGLPKRKGGRPTIAERAARKAAEEALKASEKGDDPRPVA